MKTILAKLHCLLKGHRRGKRVGNSIEDGGVRMATHNIVYRCPRCGSEWDRKAKA